MIIIIDNNAVSSLAFQSLLHDMHYSTLAVHDVYSGLRICSSIQRDIEYVFFNMYIPDLAGFEIVECIKRINVKIPVFAYSEFPDRKTIQNCKKAGLNGFIQKPFTNERLASFMQKFKLLRKEQGQN